LLDTKTSYNHFANTRKDQLVAALLIVVIVFFHGLPSSCPTRRSRFSWRFEPCWRQMFWETATLSEYRGGR